MLIEFDFQDEGHLYADCLFCILTIYGKCLLFQFLNRVILLDNPHRNKGSKGSIRTACFIFSKFKLNSLLQVVVHTYMNIAVRKPMHL